MPFLSAKMTVVLDDFFGRYGARHVPLEPIHNVSFSLSLINSGNFTRECEKFVISALVICAFPSFLITLVRSF